MSGLNGQFNARLQRLEKKAAEGGGGGSVPTPAAADTGKVLTANNGAVEWAHKAYILELLLNNSVVYVNETMSEILTIISSGTPLILHIPSSPSFSEYIHAVGYFTIPFVGKIVEEEKYIVNCGDFTLAAPTLNDYPSYNFD